jgi:hypothetical protein
MSREEGLKFTVRPDRSRLEFARCGVLPDFL